MDAVGTSAHWGAVRLPDAAFPADHPDRGRGFLRIRRVRWTARRLVRGALRGADAAPPGDDVPTGARPPTPRRDGPDRGGAQRDAVEQLKPATACQRFRGGPRSGARSRDGAARPPQSARETGLKSAGGQRMVRSQVPPAPGGTRWSPTRPALFLLEAEPYRLPPSGIPSRHPAVGVQGR